MKIAHLSSAHSRNDVRIFLKECRSLSKRYCVSYVVADGLGDDLSDDIKIYDVGAPSGRFDRIFFSPARVFRKAESLGADLFHLHDPELLPIGLRLKYKGKLVVFDAHEDVPNQILAKHYLSGPIKWVLSKLFAHFERYVTRRIDAVVSATPFIRDKFISMGVRSVDINNYPILGELSPHPGEPFSVRSDVCYIGGIAKVRGIFEMVDAMEAVTSKSRLLLAGEFSEDGLEEQLQTRGGWQSVDYLGWQDRRGVKSILETAACGLVTLHPIINYVDALPIIMFEFMAAGVPVIASNFPLWKNIVEDAGCGLCVSPLEPLGIARAIDFILANPGEAEKMGACGRMAVAEKYNWSIEEKKLFSFYQLIIDGSQ